MRNGYPVAALRRDEIVGKLAALEPEERRDFLGSLDFQEDIAVCVLTAAARAAGVDVPLVRLGMCACFVPGHEGEGLADMYLGEGGVRYECRRHSAGGRVWLGPVDVYAACVSGLRRRLDWPELVRWRARAFAEIGLLDLPDALEIVLPADASDSVRAVLAGMLLLEQIEAVIGGMDRLGFVFTRTFGARWCRLLEADVVNAIAYLRREGIVDVVDKHRPPRGHAMNVYSLQGVA